MKLVIEGAPRTKKNHTRRIQRGRRVFTVQSAAHEAWEAAAVAQLRAQHRRVLVYTSTGTAYGATIDAPCNMRALVYRDADRGDLLNFLAAVSDALQPKYQKLGGVRVCTWRGVIQDDKLIVSVDGSRLLIDRERPRVEIELTPVPA